MCCHHIEVRAGHAEKLMADERFIHRQTTAQAVRFTTTELAEMEQLSARQPIRHWRWSCSYLTSWFTKRWPLST